MSQITIQCRLVASASTRQKLWKLMAELNTPLINELLILAYQHPDFETWQHKGAIPVGIIKQLCEPLKTDARFVGQPGRFFASAIATVSYIYKSWVKVQKRLQLQIDGKARWLEMLNSDIELVEIAGVALDTLRATATELLNQLNPQPTTEESPKKKGKKAKKTQQPQGERSLSKILFDTYRDAEDIQTRCAISYLLKNGCKIRSQEEDSKKFAKRRRKVEIQIQRLTDQLASRVPKGRDLTAAKWLESLLEATRKVPENEAEAKSWQDSLNRQSSTLPFPVAFESSEDMTWFRKLKLNNIPIKFWTLLLYIDYLTVISFVRDSLQNEALWFKNLKINNIEVLIKLWIILLNINCFAGILFLGGVLKKYQKRIYVHFNGLSDCTFEVYCDSRHLHWFKRFLEDQQIKKSSKNQYSSSLFTIRSGRIAWKSFEGKGKPWNINRLMLYCCVDTRLWTAEGTKLVVEEKAEEIAKTITRTKEKETKEKVQLNDKQLAYIKRKSATLTRINNPFPRPSKPLYNGQSHILVGVSLGLEKPATLAVLNAMTGKIIAYRSVKQLLGKNYKLLNRQRHQKQALSHQRKIAQTLAAPNQFGDSELGEHIDRLLAKEIIAVAQKFNAGSIVVPNLDNMREQVNSEIQAKAEEKCPESIEAQKKYASSYRRSVNQWSYRRLIDCITNQAAKAGIVIEENKQPIRASPQDKAKELALSAYHARKKS